MVGGEILEGEIQMSKFGYKNTWLTGYAVLPCFTVRMLEGTYSAELTCCIFLQYIFGIFFSPFWNGKVFINGSYEEEI